ncbi:3-hydroxyacyl-CoA dehydrogenase family protein [Spirochaetota bacterium]
MAEIKKITVIGSGVMGSGIAAHLVNGGFTDVHLLDILPPKLSAEQEKAGYTLDDKNIRNIISRKNLNALIKGKPPQLGAKGLAEHIVLGNTTDDFDSIIAESDWVIEVVPEVAKIKNDTFKRIDNLRKPDSIISSNTSGISIKEMIDGCSDDLKKHFLITHFFNPVRFMKLLEIVKGPETTDSTLNTIVDIGTEKLGKGIVYSYDVAAFVGNRIGVFNMVFLMSLVGQYSIEERVV